MDNMYDDIYSVGIKYNIHPEVDLPYEYLGNSLWAAQTSNTLIKNVPTWQVRNAMTDFKIHLSSVSLISYLNTFVLDSIHETGADSHEISQNFSRLPPLGAIFLSEPPLTWNPGSAPVKYYLYREYNFVAYI